VVVIHVLGIVAPAAGAHAIRFRNVPPYEVGAAIFERLPLVAVSASLHDCDGLQKV
jgi:hypothetical protein